MGIYEKALERPQTFGIEGVTYFRTMGVVKSIIPAIASTNAIISAAATLEVLKLVTFCGQTLNSWYAYTGDGEQGVYTNTYEHAKKDDCIVCSVQTRLLTVPSTMTLSELRQKLCDDPEYQLKDPSMRSESGVTLYISNKILESRLGPNLKKTIGSLIADGETIIVTDKILGELHVKVQVKFS